MNRPGSRTLWKLAGAAAFGFCAWLAVLGVRFASGELPGSPIYKWHWLVAQAFSETPARVSDGEAAAISEAAGWFASAALPPVVAGGLGFLVGVFKRPMLRYQLLAAAVFSVLHVDIACCSVFASSALGAVGFSFALVGAIQLGSSLSDECRTWKRNRLGV